MNNVMKYGSLFFLLAFIVSVWASDGTDGIRTSLKADDLVVVQAGEKLYQANCASCHGQYLEGQEDWRTRDANGFLPAPPHDASGHTWHHADDLLFEITKFGPGVVVGDSRYKTMMPVYKDILRDDDIIAILSFIKNTWPEEQRTWQERANGTQDNGLNPIKKNNSDSSFIKKLLK